MRDRRPIARRRFVVVARRAVAIDFAFGPHDNLTVRGIVLEPMMFDIEGPPTPSGLILVVMKNQTTMKRYPWLLALGAGAVAAAFGAGGGAIGAAILQAGWNGPFSTFDGALLGTAFTAPIGAVVGHSAAFSKSDRSLRTDDGPR
jgi:hypothetical protein